MGNCSHVFPILPEQKEKRKRKRKKKKEKNTGVLRRREERDWMGNCSHVFPILPEQKEKRKKKKKKEKRKKYRGVAEEGRERLDGQLQPRV